MPDRSRGRLCKCEECIPSSLNGRLFTTDIVYRAHLAASLVRKRNATLSPILHNHQTIVPSSHITAGTANIQRHPPSPTITHPIITAHTSPLSHLNANPNSERTGSVQLDDGYMVGMHEVTEFSLQEGTDSFMLSVGSAITPVNRGLTGIQSSNLFKIHRTPLLVLHDDHYRLQVEWISILSCCKCEDKAEKTLLPFLRR